MGIERADDGHIRANVLSQEGQPMPVDVEDVLTDRRSMRRDEHAVEFASGLQFLKQPREQRIQSRLGDRPAGLRRRQQQGHGLNIRLLERMEKSHDLVMWPDELLAPPGPLSRSCLWNASKSVKGRTKVLDS